MGGLRRKVGLSVERDGDADLVQDLLARMAANGADFSLTFRGLCAAAEGPEGDGAPRTLFADGDAFDGWAQRWRERLAGEPTPPDLRARAMRAANPVVMPRNHLVEAVIEAAVGQGDFQPFEDLLAVLQHLNEDRPGREHSAARAERTSRPYLTFCGT